MLKNILLIATLLLTLPAVAQKSTVIRFDVVDTISHSYYSNLRVIDMRKDTNDIGTLRSGLVDIKKAIVTGKPLVEELELAFKNNLKVTISGAPQLVLVLYDLKIEDNPLNIGISTIHFDGDFYGSSKGSNAFLAQADTFIELKSTKSKLLREAQHQLNSICAAKANISYNKEANLVFGDEGMKKRRTYLRKIYPAYNRPLKNGIFFTLEQFLNNSPVDTPVFTVELSLEKTADQFRFYYVGPNGNKGDRIEEEDYFAVADSGMLALSAEDRAVKTVKKDDDYYTTLPMSLANDRQLFAAVQGLAGVAATGVLLNSKYGRGIYYCKLDPATGIFKPFKRIQ